MRPALSAGGARADFFTSEPQKGDSGADAARREGDS